MAGKLNFHYFTIAMNIFIRSFFLGRFLLLSAFLFCVSVSHAQPVDVMTYNIRLDTPADGINQWGKRKEKVFDLLEKYAPDIIGVQEALHHQLVDITENLPQYGYVGVGRDDGKQEGEYSAVLYKKDRFEVLAQNTFWLSETPEVPGSKHWDAAITRVATWARFKDKESGSIYLVVNTHFDHIGKEARTKSAALLKTKASEIGKNLPVIITGDLNCTRDEPPYKTMMQKSNLMLIDPAPANPAGTFCNFAVNVQECRAIDYIFHNGKWKAEDYQVIQDNDGKNYPSDHLPVMVELNLKD
jgi:endonuclease/exonuclease/phosphatase family metal-dependent hydrolase